MCAILITVRVLLVTWCLIIKVNNSTGEFGYFPWDFPASRVLVQCYTIMLSAAAVNGNEL